MRRAVPVVGLLAGLSCLCGESASGGEPQLASDLAGVWTGKRDTWPVGDCSGGKKGAPVRLTLEALEDGGFSGVAETGPGFIVLESRWRARPASADKWDVTLTVHGTCHGVRREYDVALRGRARTDNGKTRLVVEGKNTVCPELRCSFGTRYTLERER